MENKEVLEIQAIDPYGDEWHTGQFPFMTKEQLFKVLHKTLNGYLDRIIELKKKLRWGTNIDDIARLEIVNCLLMEMQKKFFDKEVIPVKK